MIQSLSSMSKYSPFAGSSYIKLRKELDHPGQGLINVQNINDNECFDRVHHSARITKADKDFAET